MSGQDKAPQNNSTPNNSIPLASQASYPPNNGPSPLSLHSQDKQLSQVSAQAMGDCRVSSGAYSVSPVDNKGDFEFLRSLQDLLP